MDSNKHGEWQLRNYNQEFLLVYTHTHVHMRTHTRIHVHMHAYAHTQVEVKLSRETKGTSRGEGQEKRATRLWRGYI